MKQKVIVIVIISIILFSAGNNCLATENTIKEVGTSLNIEGLITTLNEYTKDIDLDEMSDSLLNGDGIDYDVIGKFVSSHLLLEIKSSIKTALSIVIILVLLAVIKSLELEKEGTISSITNLIGFLLIVTMLIKNYSSNLILLKETINSLTNIVSVVSPVMLAILIATGEIVTSGIISPILLFLTGSIGVVVSNIIIPLLTLSLVLNIITKCSNVVKLDRISKICSSSAMWIVSVVFALFLGVLGLESSISTSIDGVTVKTTQAAVSNMVPVVGKFLSDSIEIVMGASELIGKSVGVIGIIVMIVILVVPLIKMIVICIMYKLLEAFSETILSEEKISQMIGAFSRQYTSIIGIMIGISATFIIAIGIVMNLFGKAIGG